MHWFSAVTAHSQTRLGHITHGALRFSLCTATVAAERRTVHADFFFLSAFKLHRGAINGASERKISRQSKKKFPHDYAQALCFFGFLFGLLLLDIPNIFSGYFPAEGLGTTHGQKIERAFMFV